MSRMTTCAPARSILIAGIGNIFLGDDAFGVEVAQRLAARAWPDGVRVTDFGIRGFDLAFALLDGVDLTIFVDATPQGKAPGTLYLMVPGTDQIDADIGDARIEAHSMHPVAVLRLVKMMGGEFRRLLIVGCEPESCDEGIGLSACVANAVDCAIEMIDELVSTETRGSA